MMVTIRPSRPDDHDALFHIWRDAVLATHDFLTEQDFCFFEALVRDRYIPGSDFWCAVDGEDRPVAFLGMTEDRVDALFVAPDQHKRGIGSALLDHARRLSSNLLLDVNEQNDGAVLFYERQGFRRTGRSETDDTGRPYPLLHMALEEVP